MSNEDVERTSAISSPCVVFSCCCVCSSYGSSLWPGQTLLPSPPMGIGSPEYSLRQGHSAPPEWYRKRSKSFFPFTIHVYSVNMTLCLFNRTAVLCLWQMVIPFWSVSAPWPGRCGRMRWWTGSAVQGQQLAHLCFSEQNCAEFRSSWTPWSAYTALKKQTLFWSHDGNNYLVIFVNDVVAVVEIMACWRE